MGTTWAVWHKMSERQQTWTIIAEAFGTPIHLRTEEQLRLTSACLIRAYYIITDELAEPVLDFMNLFDTDDYWMLPGREDLKKESQLIIQYDETRTDIASLLGAIPDKEYAEIIATKPEGE